MLSNKGFALLLFSIILSFGATAGNDWFLIAGMVIGLIGLIMVFCDRKEDKK